MSIKSTIEITRKDAETMLIDKISDILVQSNSLLLQSMSNQQLEDILEWIDETIDDNPFNNYLIVKDKDYE